MSALRRALAGLASLLVASGAHADVAFDGSIGGGVPGVAPTRAAPGFARDYLVTYDESVAPGLRFGERRGANLFQSLDRLDLADDERATFRAFDATGLAITDLERVIARVTSTNPTLIEGVLRSEIPGADLFLLNPAGIEFRGRTGQRLQLDVPAGFTATTADFLRFDDPGVPSGVVFDALDTSGVELSTGPIEGYGFLGTNRGEVRFDFSQPELATGETLRVVAGDAVFTSDSVVRMPGGAVEIAATGQGAVFVPAEVSAWATRGGPSDTYGEIVVDALSEIRTTDVAESAPQGRVILRGGRLVVEDARVQAGGDGGPEILALDAELTDEIDARVDARLQTSGDRDVGIGAGRLSAARVLVRDEGTFVGADLTSSSAGTFTVDADAVTVSDGAVLGSTALSAESSGDLVVTTGTLVVASGGLVRTNVSGADAPGGDVTIIASDSITIGAGSAIRSENQVLIGSFLFQGGQAGDLDVTTPSLRLEAGGRIEALTGAEGDGGDVRIAAGTIALESRAQIRTSTRGDRDGGDLDVVATGSLSIAGDDPSTPAGIFARTGAVVGAGIEAGTGDAGDVTVTSPDIALTGSAVISARSLGEGSPGSITIRAGAPAPGVDVDATGLTLRLTGTADGAAEISTRARTGDTGGAIDITMDQVVVEDGGAIAASTSGTSPGGLITVTAGSLTLGGQRPGVSPDTAAILSDASSESSDGGAAGAIAIDLAGDLLVDAGGEIRARTRGGGDAGAISIAAGGSVGLRDGGRISAAALGTATGEAGDVSIAAETVSIDGGEVATEAANGTADGMLEPIGGDLAISAGEEVLLTRGAVVSASSLGTQDAGRITIGADRRLVVADSRIATEATIGDAAGGQIELRALDRIELLRSRVSTSVRASEGDENGGDISLDPHFVLVNRSEILAQAVRGDGGNIRIVAGTFLESNDSLIDASSDFGVDGTVVVEGPEDQLKGGLVRLPSEFLDATRLLGERCAARDAARVGSFVVGDRTGRPASPGRPLAAPMPLPVDLEPGHRGRAAPGEAALLAGCPRWPDPTRARAASR